MSSKMVVVVVGPSLSFCWMSGQGAVRLVTLGLEQKNLFPLTTLPPPEAEPWQEGL